MRRSSCMHAPIPLSKEELHTFSLDTSLKPGGTNFSACLRSSTFSILSKGCSQTLQRCRRRIQVHICVPGIKCIPSGMRYKRSRQEMFPQAKLAHLRRDDSHVHLLLVRQLQLVEGASNIESGCKAVLLGKRSYRGMYIGHHQHCKSKASSTNITVRMQALTKQSLGDLRCARILEHVLHNSAPDECWDERIASQPPQLRESPDCLSKLCKESQKNFLADFTSDKLASKT